MVTEESPENEKGSASRLRIAGGIVALLISVIAGISTVIWYRQGTSDPYVLPDAWGRISIYIPPQARSCAAGMTMSYDQYGTQNVTVIVKLDGLPHLKYGPAIGIIFDGSAVPPDSPWPYFGDLHVTGTLPSTPWAEYGLPFGPYLGMAWLIRLAKPGQSFQFHVSYPGSEVSDGKPTNIDGTVSDKDGADLLTISTRLTGNFRIEDGGRITYKPPLFEDFVALPSLSNPAKMRDISNALPSSPIKICTSGDRRITFINDSESVDQSGAIDPYYQVDSAEPTPTQSDQLLWETNFPGQELAPVVSLLSRPAEENHQKLMFWSAGGLAVTVTLLPIGLAQMPWPALERRRRARKRRKKSLLGPYCILTLQNLSELRVQKYSDGTFTLRRQRAWKTGQQLWTEASRAGLHMPILFSTSEDQANISYWGVIDKISIDDGAQETTCIYSAVRTVEPPRQLSELRLRNGGKPLAQKPTIRSHAICHTPEFLA